MTVYYVSSGTGSDSDNGTSPTTSFATLQHAADLTKPGDVVEVMNGTYTVSGSGQYGVMVVRNSGTASAPITYEAAPGQDPVINSSGQQTGIVVDGASYVTVKGFEVVGDAASVSLSYAQSQANHPTPTTAGKGIAVWTSTGSDPTHITIEDNAVNHEPGAGIWAGDGDYISILNNTSYDNAWWSPEADSGISVGWMKSSDANTGYKVIVAGNTVYGNREYIPNMVDGIITDGNGIIVDTNNQYSYNGRTLVENNVSYDNGGSGIHAWGSNNVDILYNTAYDNGGAISDPGQIFAGGGSSGGRIENNSICSTGGEDGLAL
jgi:hypothetical protein